MNTLSGLSKTPIWPEYSLTEHTERDSKDKVYRKKLEFYCVVRIKGTDEKYYLTLFSDSMNFEVTNDGQVATYLSMFLKKKIQEIYIFSNCAVVDENAKNIHGQQVFALDYTQESEKERLSKLYSF